MKKFTTLLINLALILGVVAAPLASAVPVSAQANDPNAEALCKGSGGTWSREDQACNSTSGRTVPGTIRQITNILIFLVGAIAVLMIIIGGLRYVLSAGDQSATTSAKNTILYAIIGLVVAIMAYAIVNFVLDALNIK